LEWKREAAALEASGDAAPGSASSPSAGRRHCAAADEARARFLGRLRSGSARGPDAQEDSAARAARGRDLARAARAHEAVARGYAAVEALVAEHFSSKEGKHARGAPHALRSARDGACEDDAFGCADLASLGALEAAAATVLATMRRLRGAAGHRDAALFEAIRARSEARLERACTTSEASGSLDARLSAFVAAAPRGEAAPLAAAWADVVDAGASGPLLAALEALSEQLLRPLGGRAGPTLAGHEKGSDASAERCAALLATAAEGVADALLLPRLRPRMRALAERGGGTRDADRGTCADRETVAVLRTFRATHSLLGGRARCRFFARGDAPFHGGK
jgi:hypothetical protein